MRRSSAQLKTLARQSLDRQWGLPVSACFLIALFSFIPAMIITMLIDPYSMVSQITCQILTYIVSLLVSLILTGYKRLLLDMNRRKPLSLSSIFCTFSEHPDRFLVVNMILLLVEVLLALPLDMKVYLSDGKNMLLPFFGSLLIHQLTALILALFFGFSNYILLDNPQVNAIESMKLSLKLLKGQKGRFFRLYLSFLPLYILCIFTCYIGFLWLRPYMETTLAYFYMDVTGELDRPKEEASFEATPFHEE